MRYTPELSAKEIEENHVYFSKRISLYKEKGFDFIGSRRFMLKKAGPLQGNILELGTGTGYMTLALARTGYKFISIDKDEGVLKIAALNLAYEKVLSNVDFHVMDGKSLIFKNGSFKNIICVNIFHHINEVNKVLSEIDRVICANGKAVLTDFNEKGMKIVNSTHKQEGRMHENSDVTKDTIYPYFCSLGYEIKEYADKYHWVLICKKLIRK